ncbi:tRNA (adenosine(37)-N6)-threonylcarbamoyltransferase complex dimerization subunit type 1 TsaB [Planctomycetaceae bacterium SH139]
MTHWQIAIETSCRLGSVALLRQDRPVEQIVLAADQRTAQTLAPALHSLLGRLRAAGGKLEGISVGVGPGSFTGLRIGVTAAKSLAYALRCPVAAVDTLQAMILPMRRDFPEQTGYDAVLNAYRGQVFWRREAADGQPLMATQVIDETQWRQQLNTPGLLAAGDVWSSRGEWAEQWQACQHGRVTTSDYWTPRAEEVGRLGWSVHCRGQAVDPLNLKPNYLRESAAAEKKNSARQGQSLE